MVNLNIDAIKNTHTTKNIDNLKFEEMVVSTKDSKLKFYFKGTEPYLSVDDKEYPFETSGSTIHFLQKLFLNSAVISSLSNETLTIVANEILQKRYNDHMPTINLIVNKNTNQIFTVTSTSADLVSWDKIVRTVHEVFAPLEEKSIFFYTSAGLDLSILMNNPENNESYVDVIRIGSQTPSSISIYRGPAREEVPLRGYDEAEVMVILKEKLQLMIDVDPRTSKDYSLVQD